MYGVLQMNVTKYRLQGVLIHCVKGILQPFSIYFSEGELATDQWQQTYGRHSGNEIYHIQLGRSAFFRGYEGKPFTEASADAHQRSVMYCGALLI